MVGSTTPPITRTISGPSRASGGVPCDRNQKSRAKKMFIPRFYPTMTMVCDHGKFKP